jgi:cell division protein FtsZ
LAIGEFQEVGDTIKQFASDDATVVIGTVIDPEMAQEIRVTVVATGLGQAAAAEHAPMKVVRKNRARETNYRDFDTPAVQRRQSAGDDLLGEDEALQELLDVPAFLRRQAN